MRNFSYTPGAGFHEEFLLLTLLELVLVRSFSYTPGTDFNEEFLLHSSSWF